MLIALARIMAAAHYLSDVSMGATLTLTFATIANEILIKVMKPKKVEDKVEEDEVKEEEPKQEEKAEEETEIAK